MTAFHTDDPNMLGDWLVAGPVSSLAGTSAARPRATRLLGADIALWRDADGTARARCGSQDLLLQERYHYLWLCPGGTPARALFAFPEVDEPGRRIVDCGGIGVHVAGLRIVENFLDMAHFPYVHPHYLGELPHTEVAAYDVAIDPASDEIVATDCRFWQPRSSAAAGAGIQAHYRYRVMQPLAAMLYKTSGGDPARLDALALFVQPVDEERAIAYCLMAWIDDVTPEADLIAFQHTIFGQDKPILENHVPRRLPLDGRLEAATRADLASATYRRWLRGRGLRFGVHPG